MLHFRAMNGVIPACGFLWAFSDTDIIMIFGVGQEHMTKVGYVATGHKHLEAEIAWHGIGSTNIAQHGLICSGV